MRFLGPCPFPPAVVPQIQDGMRGSLFQRGVTGERAPESTPDPKDPDLVAYWWALVYRPVLPCVCHPFPPPVHATSVSSPAAAQPRDPASLHPSSRRCLPPVSIRNFDEGRGWRVRDITGRGHDLIAAETPRWEVVRWLSVCGNGGRGRV